MALPDRLDILFRSCSRVLSVHGSHRGGTRVLDLQKPEIILTCLRSLVRSIEAAQAQVGVPTITLTVLDDHSDEETLAGIRSLLAGRAFQTSLVPLEITGNGPSLRANYEHARANCPGLIYFVEDDYLHAPSAILEMLGAFAALSERAGQEAVIFPCDYPDRYHQPYPSVILAGPGRYWRSIQHTTGTFLTTRAILEKHWERYAAFGEYGVDPQVTEASTINRVYDEVPCFSPMPSLTVHLHHPESLSPFVDWQTWLAENRA